MQYALGNEIGRQVAEALNLSDIENIRAITIRLQANDVATVEVDRYVPVGSTAIGLLIQNYRLVPVKSDD